MITRNKICGNSESALRERIAAKDLQKREAYEVADSTSEKAYNFIAKKSLKK